jgi:hypothetical protein
MNIPKSAVPRSVVVLSITQIIGWGAMFMAISVTGDAMAADLQLGRGTIFLGPTIMLVAMALCSPLMGRLYRTYGARLVLAVVRWSQRPVSGCSPPPMALTSISLPGAFSVSRVRPD